MKLILLYVITADIIWTKYLPKYLSHDESILLKSVHSFIMKWDRLHVLLFLYKNVLWVLFFFINREVVGW